MPKKSLLDLSPWPARWDDASRPLIPIRPHPMQWAFLWTQKPRILFGGAAGPGKTISVLAAALQYVRSPGYSALLMRRTYPELAQPRGLMHHAREWLYGSGAEESKTDNRWTFPSGATLQFGHAQHEGDEMKYSGAEFHFIGIDEAAQFTERQLGFMHSRLRRTLDSAIPMRMRFCSNPEGPAVQYLKREFIDPETRSADAIYIPSRMDDNPSLDVASYLASLQHLDPIRRARLIEGDWNVRDAGTMFHREWVRTFPPDTEFGPALAEVRSWDFAATVNGDYTVGVRMSLLRPGAPVRWLIRHAVRGRWTPGTRDAVIVQTAAADGRSVRVRLEQEPGSGGIAQVDAIIRALAGYWVDSARPTGDKGVRAGPFCSQAEAGQVGVLAGSWTSWFLDELEAFPESGRDVMDATSQAFDALTFPGNPGPVDLAKTKLAPHQLEGMMPGLRRDDNWDDD